MLMLAHLVMIDFRVVNFSTYPPGCWFAGGYDLTGGFARPMAPVVTTASIILCFNKHRLTQVHLENGR